jgi:signal transduction histidine kinase
VTLHSLLPGIALLLNVSLGAIALAKNAGSRLNRLFAYFVAAMAMWNFGVLGLRLAPDEPTAYFWEVVVHVGIILAPIFYYHFTVAFLERTIQHRVSLAIGYGLAMIFLAVNLFATPLMHTGVKMTHWGWVPTTGPLYLPFFVYLYAFMILGFVRLKKAYNVAESSSRRNRILLTLIGTAVTLAGGFIDFVRFIAARFIPVADQLYPVGIPANAIFALLLGVSIVRYRLFNVHAAAKKSAVYLAVGVVITVTLYGLSLVLEQYVGVTDLHAMWVIVPLGVLFTLLLTPLKQPVEDLIQRTTFTKRRGCYDTLLELSKRMSTILNLNKLVDTLVQGLVRGVPITHCALMIYDQASNAFVAWREEQMVEGQIGVASMPAGSAVVEWLKGADGVLVKEEARLDPRMAAYFQASEAELEVINASLIVPLKVEGSLIGILLLGEKLSGEIFDADELEVLSLLANQAAISLENARLYEELGSSNARLQQASRAKSQFLASMSHELRTPLNAIIGFSKVLLNQRDGDLSERQEAYVRSVHNSSTHLLHLINSILDISRIEAGKVELVREAIDLPELVGECVETSTALLRGKPVRIEADVPLVLPRIDGDRTKVKQVLLNLLSNAVKFTPQGRVAVQARPQKDRVHVSVADTGIGIREADLPRLFVPFERLDNPLAQHADGTGLGLAISRKFVELHGGEMWVESREGRGSTFHFTLPVKAASS